LAAKTIQVPGKKPGPGSRHGYRELGNARCRELILKFVAIPEKSSGASTQKLLRKHVSLISEYKFVLRNGWQNYQSSADELLRKDILAATCHFELNLSAGNHARKQSSTIQIQITHIVMDFVFDGPVCFTGD
jgi:hypothetical protein